MERAGGDRQCSQVTGTLRYLAIQDKKLLVSSGGKKCVSERSRGRPIKIRLDIANPSTVMLQAKHGILN